MRKISEVAVLCCLAIALGPAKAQVPLDEPGKRGTLEVVVIDSFGSLVAGATLYMQRLGTREVSPKIEIDRIPLEAIDYGAYRLTAETPGFEFASRVVQVHDRLTTAVVVLVPGDIEKDGRATVVNGQIKDSTLASECNWIRLVPLFVGGEPLDAKLYQGKFSVENAKPGKYAAVLLGGRGVCHISTVDIKLGTTQSIIIP